MNRTAVFFLLVFVCFPSFLVAQLKEDEGFLMLMVKENQTLSNNAGGNLSSRTISVENIDNGDKFSLFSDVKSGQSFYFGEALEIGRYVITELSYASGFGMSTTSTFDKGMYRFEIKPGVITYLDEIIYSYFYSEKEEKVLPLHIYNSKLDKKKAINILNTFFPKYAKLSGENMIGWAKSDFNTEMEERYQKNKKVSFGLFSPTELKNGKVIFGSTIGMLRVWDPKTGDFSRVSLPTHSSLESFLELEDGSLFVGGEHAELFYSTGLDGTWIKNKSNIPFGTIAGIHKVDDALYLVVKQGDKVVVVKGNFDEDWKVVAETPHKSLNCNACPEDNFSREYNEKIYFATRKFVNMYDAKSGLFTTNKLKRRGHTRILEAGIVQTKQMAIWETKDFGEQWKKVPKSLMFFQSPLFIDKERGVRLRGKRFKYLDIYVETTNDGGKNWEETHIFNMYKNNLNLLRILPINKLILATDTLNDLFVSKDDGKSWEKVKM